MPTPFTLPPELEPYRARLAATARPTCEITFVPDAGLEVTDSRLGGAAYLPAGERWPVTDDGAPLHLIAQINFAQAPPMPDHPSRGIWQLFLPSDDLYGMGMDDDAPSFALRWWPNPSITAARVDPPAFTDDTVLPLWRDQPMRMIFGAPHPMPVTEADRSFDAVISDDTRREIAAATGLELGAVEDLVSERLATTGHRLGGYPHFTQWDPRGDGEDTVLFLQLDSDEAAGLQWGDAGVGNLFISPADLAAREFGRMRYHWDCH